MDKKQVAELMAPFRARIDDLDVQILDLLKQRYDIIREVGHFKSGHGIAPVQHGRVVEVRENAVDMGVARGLEAEFVRALYILMIDHAHDIETSIIESKAA